jgi:hypothetical protein
MRVLIWGLANPNPPRAVSAAQESLHSGFAVFFGAAFFLQKIAD